MALGIKKTLAAGRRNPSDQDNNISPKKDELEEGLIQRPPNSVIKDSDKSRPSPPLSTVLASSSGWLQMGARIGN